MKHGYIRLTKGGPSAEKQKAALTAAGVAPDRLHSDDQRKAPTKRSPDPWRARSQAILCCGDGDELVVSSAGRLGYTVADVRDALVAVAARGASVFDATAGVTVRYVSDVAIVFAFEDRAKAELDRERIRPARVAGGTDQPMRKWNSLSAKQRERAKAMWLDRRTYTTQAVVIETGCSRRTLYDVLGGRKRDAQNG
jgi:hypothetical protein